MPRSSIRLGIGLSSLLTAGRISDMRSIARSALPMRELLCSVLSAHLDAGKNHRPLKPELRSKFTRCFLERCRG